MIIRYRVICPKIFNYRTKYFGHEIFVIYGKIPNSNKFDIHVPYPRKREPMDGAPYIRPILGDGPISDVSVSHLDTKERPSKLPTLSS